MNEGNTFSRTGFADVGMGRDLSDALPACKAVFERANEVVGYDLTSICFDGPQEELNLSHHAQLGIFVSRWRHIRRSKSADKLATWITWRVIVWVSGQHCT